MAGTIVVDRLESDASYASSINIASPIVISNTVTFTSNTVLTSNVLYLSNTNNFALQFQPDVAGRLRIASSASTFGDNNPFLIERPSSAAAQNDAITIRAGGVVDLGKGQLKFPASQNASADANTLDDYEEGTWTPTGPTGFPGGGISVSIGTYTKIGNVVHAFGFMTAKNDGTTMMIGGLPFATSYYEAISLSHETLTVRYQRMLSGESTIRFVFSATQTGAFQEIFIQATYRAS